MRLTILLSVALSVLASCGRHDVVLYVATDQNTSSRVVALFEQATGLRVRARYDTEADKTVGIVNALIQEQENPRCDVFWNNEIVHTARLMKLGLLEPYDSPSAADIPPPFRGPGNHYTGFAARARVLIVNTDRLPDPADRPTSMWDLIAPRFRGMATMARPLTGTTLTHVAALFTSLGEVKANRFLGGLAGNGTALLKGNGQTMRQVGSGEFAFGFTDTDDFNVALNVKKLPVAVVYPDQDGCGTFVIPNTVALIKGAPHPENARRLIDFLLSKEVEALLASSRSAQIPVRRTVARPDHVRSAESFKVAAWDPLATAEWMERNMDKLTTRGW